MSSKSASKRKKPESSKDVQEESIKESTSKKINTSTKKSEKLSNGKKKKSVFPFSISPNDLEKHWQKISEIENAEEQRQNFLLVEKESKEHRKWLNTYKKLPYPLLEQADRLLTRASQNVQKYFIAKQNEEDGKKVLIGPDSLKNSAIKTLASALEAIEKMNDDEREFFWTQRQPLNRNVDSVTKILDLKVHKKEGSKSDKKSKSTGEGPVKRSLLVSDIILTMDEVITILDILFPTEEQEQSDNEVHETKSTSDALKTSSINESIKITV
jgi:hypothetical protein